MKQMKLRRQTTHYDERMKQIDGKICELIKYRKEISNNNPGYPPFKYMSNWAEKFGLYEELLKSIFSLLWNERLYEKADFVHGGCSREENCYEERVEITTNSMSIT